MPSGPPLIAPLGTTPPPTRAAYFGRSKGTRVLPGSAHYGPTYARQPPQKNLDVPYRSHGLDRPRHIGRAREGQNRSVKQLGS